MNLKWNGSPPDSILIVKPSSLGDIVHTLPAVAALKKFWPASSIRWLVNPEWAPVLEGNPYLDEVLIFPRACFRGVCGAWRMFEWARQFGREHRAELVLDFQGLFRSAAIGRFAREGLLLGLSDAREGAGWFYDSTVGLEGHPDVPMHAVDRYFQLVRALGVPALSPEKLEWPLPEAPLPVGFSADEPYVALHPFSRGDGKSMSITDVRRLCETLAPHRVVLLGRSGMDMPPMPNVVNYLNKTSMAELISMLKHAAWVVSVDSGPVHLAAAFSPRVLSLHTWTDPRKVGPYPGDAWVLKEFKIRRRAAPEVVVASAPHMEALGTWVLGQLAARLPHTGRAG
jgi:ADP-heptose:LPS heptosyltransferase